MVDTTTLSESLFRLAVGVAADGIASPAAGNAAQDVLMARGPLLPSSSRGLGVDDDAPVKACRRLVSELESGVLAIQGPPGAGKTYTGARMIAELVKAGQTVGVTAVSHKVIRNLLEAVVVAGHEIGRDIRCVEKITGKVPKEEGVIREMNHPKKSLLTLQAGTAHVVGGTAWLWARADAAGAVDVLVVDEAGQMSLADVAAAAQAARSVVLLGDPQQLEQPMVGSHPVGTAVSVLEHFLGPHRTLPADRGIFLPETWRLHPAICRFTSELFYEGRLSPRPGLENQRLSGVGRFDGAGLWFVPADHEDCQTNSPNEAELIAKLVGELTQPGSHWVDADRNAHPLTLEDVLVVAPYNAQVAELGKLIPNARVGTVDKFQGQEAPVVIYSMTSSSPEDAPRGMEFLFSLNRLNVATSRARCACILVANPTLLGPECRTPRQIQLANAFCRYLEMAKTLHL